MALKQQRYSDEEYHKMKMFAAQVDNPSAMAEIQLHQNFFDKDVIVTKGKKVPIGTKGKVFWLGGYNNSKYGDTWGIYTSYRCGIKDDDGNVYWTNVNNIELY